MLNRISSFSESAFGIFLSLSIALFGVNHRWSIVATLLAMIFGFTASRYKNSRVEADLKKLLAASYIAILTFTAVVFFGLWYHDSAINYYDNYSRLFLLSPIIYLIVKLDVHSRHILIGLFLGAVSITYNAVTYSDDWGGRASLTYYNSLAMSNVAGEFLAIIAALFLFSKNDLLKKGVLLVLLLSLFVVVLLTGTKGVWLTVLTICLLAFFQLNTLKKRVLLFGFVVFLSVIVNYATNNMPVKRLNVALDSVSCLLSSENKLECEGASVMERATMWVFVAKSFPDAPFLGHGTQNFSIGLTKAAEAGVVSGKHSLRNNPHNDFAKLLYDFGLLGLLALTGLFLSLVLIAKKVVSSKKSSGVGWGHALLLHTVFFVELGLTQSNFAVSSQALHFAFFTCLLLGLAIRSISGKAHEIPLNVRE